MLMRLQRSMTTTAEVLRLAIIALLIQGVLSAQTPAGSAKPHQARQAAKSSRDLAGGSAEILTRQTAADVAQLKAQLVQQQLQIEQLQSALDQQKLLLERTAQTMERLNSSLIEGRPAEAAALATAPASAEIAAAGPTMTPAARLRPVKLGEVASLIPSAPTAQVSSAPGASKPSAASTQNNPPDSGSNPCEAGYDGMTIPPYLRLGSTCITPVGFMDFITVWRDKNAGSGIGSSFGNVPYNNTIAGNLSEFRFSAQNSRVGARVESKFKGTHVLGYLESDFLGFVPSNAAVTTNADTLRLRLYWVDLRRDKLEILGGQSWSMLTPNRRGLSALPGDLFYSQVIDVNYMNGLTWSRAPQFRIIYHPTQNIAAGLSFEAPEQYIGGSGGGGVVTLPTNLAAAYASQLDNGSTTLGVPNLHPDIIAKIAWDPSSRFHGEIAGLFRTVKVYNPTSDQHYAASGGGLSVNFNLELIKNLRLVTNNFWSDGGGRYLFGVAPDTVIRGDGSPSLVHAGSTVSGLEATLKNSLLYAYYGGIYIGRNAQIDPANGRPVGYGYAGSSNAHNRYSQEVTFGFNQTIWRNPRYGAVNFMGQYAYLFREPWFAAQGSPQQAHLNMLLFNFRYSLPGSAPTLK